MYIRLLCLQANKGHVTKKDMLNICKTYDEDISVKFVDRGNDMYVNEMLEQVMDQRKAYTESRRNNRKGRKTLSHDNHMNNICETYDQHMVNVNVNENVNEDKILLIPKMLEIFKTKNPTYLIDKAKDYEALGAISRDIARHNNIAYNVSDANAIESILQVWTKITVYVLSDNFFRIYSLHQISKHLQTILQSMTHGKSKQAAEDWTKIGRSDREYIPI